MSVQVKLPTLRRRWSLVDAAEAACPSLHKAKSLPPIKPLPKNSTMNDISKFAETPKSRTLRRAVSFAIRPSTASVPKN